MGFVTRRRVLLSAALALFVIQLASIGERVGASRAILKSSLSADSQRVLEAALPRPVLQAKPLLDTSGATAFALSRSLNADVWIRQRAVEFLYPRRLDPAADHLLADPNDPIPPSCTEVERAPLVVLHDCTH